MPSSTTLCATALLFHASTGSSMPTVLALGLCARRAQSTTRRARRSPFGVTFDIDDRRRAEEERRTLAAVAENSEDFIGVSGRTCALFRRSAPDARFWTRRCRRSRTSVLDYFAHVAREDRGGSRAAVRGIGSWKGELLFRHFRTGEEIPVLYNIFPIRGPDGEDRRLRVRSRDLRKEQEATRAIQGVEHDSGSSPTRCRRWSG